MGLIRKNQFFLDRLGRVIVPDNLDLGKSETPQDRSCAVQELGSLKIVADYIDTFRVKCQYNGHVWFNCYAPEIGGVVLQTTDTTLDSMHGGLRAFERDTD